MEQGEATIDNPNSAAIWHYSTFDQNGDGEFDFEEEMHRSCGTVAIKDDLLYIADFSGLFHCLNAKTGKVNWTYDMLAAAWGSPLIVDGHVYIGDEDGDVCIFELSAEPHEPIEEINMGNSVYSTPVVANGVLFICQSNARVRHPSEIGQRGQRVDGLKSDKIWHFGPISRPFNPCNFRPFMKHVIDVGNCISGPSCDPYDARAAF